MMIQTLVLCEADITATPERDYQPDLLIPWHSCFNRASVARQCIHILEPQTKYKQSSSKVINNGYKEVKNEDSQFAGEQHYYYV